VEKEGSKDWAWHAARQAAIGQKPGQAAFTIPAQRKETTIRSVKGGAADSSIWEL
jgi:hypothetical protein